MARCGRPVVAASAGRVRVSDYQASGAGNYVVISDKRSGLDYVYMHMLRRPAVQRNDRVRPGQKIGLIGSTGRSSACHLHFEMWTEPGWYEGGDPTNPKPFLRRLDRDH